MDKQVNVKITANTSKFKKAISDATKSLDKMKKSGEKVGKTKIDKNLNKQFKNISKESKKTDKQFKQNTKNLKKLNKTKLNNINKQFSNTSKSSKNFDKQLHQNSKNLKDLNKTKLSGITKQFTNMDKTVSNNKKTLGALQKELNNLKPKSIDSINKSLITTSSGASTASKNFTSVKNELNNLSNRNIETLNRSISTLSGKCPTVSKEINNIKNNVDKINGNKFSTLSSKLDGIKTKASNAGSKIKDLKSKISDAAKASFQKLVDSITKVNTEGTKSGNVFTNIGNKLKSLASGALGSLGGKISLVISSVGKMGSSFSLAGIAAAGAMTKLGASIGVTCLKFAKNASAMLGSINRMSKLTKEAEKLKKTNADLSKKQDDFLNKVNKLNESFSRGTISEEKYKQELSKLSKEQNKLNKESNKFLSTLDKFGQKVANQTTKMGGLAQKNDKLANKLKDLVNRYNELASANGKATLSFDQLINKSTKAGSVFKSLGSIMKSIGGALISVPKRFFNSFKKGLSNFKDGMKGVKESLGNIFNNLSTGNFSGVFGSLKELGASLFKAMPNWVKAVIALVVALKKLYDLGKKRFFEGLSAIKNDFQPVINGLTNLANGMKTAFTELTGFQFRLSSIITVGANFENQMKKVSVIAKSVGDEEQQLTAKARELGASTRYSASQVGEAFEYMAMAGWSTDEMLKGVQSTLDLATIGATDLGTASDILTDDLTALGLQANQASDFADKLAATITSANTDVIGFGESMKQVGSLAGALGINMTDLATSIGLMANAGIKGSKAGMSLKNLLANMASPTKAQAKALKNLNVAYDEENGYVKTTKEGNIDLEKTIKSLKKSLEGKTRAEKASAVATIAGKNALPGVMALLNATEEEYDELSDKIDNSTSTVHMFNQNMHDVGEVGSDAQKRIEHMKKVFDKTEISATSLGLSSKELGYTISLLGNDSKVSAGNVEQLLDVIESMDNATGDVDKFWRTVGNAKNVKIDGKSINQMIDYNKTLQAIDDSTIGLSDHTIKYAKAHGESVLMTKEYVKNKVKECKTIEEANQFLKEYGLTEDKKNQLLTAKAMSFKDLSYADKIDYLRQTFKGCTKEQIKNKLASEGLAKSYDEVYEIAHMNNEEYKKYKKNLDIIEGASRRMAETMDETTVAAFYGLASAMEDSLIALFDKMKPAIMNATDALTDFFETWRNGEKNEYTFDGFEKGIEGLKEKVHNASKQIPQFITDAINGIKRFVTGGSLDNILAIGTDIVQNICKGISNNKENIRTTVSGLIDKIGHWIIKNGPAIKKALTDVFSAIKDAVDENRDTIRAAADTLMDIAYTYLEGKDSVMYDLGGMLATKFIEGGLRAIARYPIKWGDAVKGVVGDLNSSNHSAYSDQVVTNKQWNGKDSKKQSKNNSNIVYAAEIEKAKKAGNKTVDVYKETVAKRLKDKFITENDAKEIEKALDRGEQAKKGAWKTTKAYISELQSQLANGDINTDVFDAKLEKLSMVDKAKSAADKTSKAYYDSLEAGIMSGDVDLSAVDSILTSLDASDAVYKTASDTGKTYLDALKQQLISGQITPEEFNALIFSSNFEEAAKKYTETGKIEAGDVIDAKSFSNVQEVNDLMDALDDLNEKYSKLSGTITDSCKKMADSTRSNFLGIANIVRNQMVNVANIVRNQMLNCTNIARNQFTNISNIVKNQSSNARNAATSQFISLKKVISTQLSEARQIVTSKMISISKVVNTQSSNARNNATRHFISLRKVIQTQMSEAYSSVSSYMNKIAHATNRTLSTKVNVTKSVKTVDAGKSSALAALSASAFNSLNAMALSGSGLTYATATGGSSGIGLSGANNSSANQAMYFELPTYLDGKVVAKTTARYMNNELTILDKKNSRKRGNK